MMKGGMAGLMKQAQQMQEKMQKMQEELANAEVTGQSGAGLVSVVMTGRHDVRRVTLDESLLQEDKEILEDLIAAAVNDARTITITYTASLNGNAVIGSPCNVNSINLEYSHNPNAWQDHNNQPGNEVKVCTGEIALRKVDAKNQKLTGAKFTIAQGTNNKTPLKLVSLGKGNYRLATSSDTTTTTTFEAGETKIQGLKGEYTITETQAPQDYSPLMLPSAVVTVNVDDTNMTWSLDVKSDPNNLIKKGDSHTVVVTNIRTITEIPLTGAAGLTMLFSIAALLFIGGIVMLRMCRSSND